MPSLNKADSHPDDAVSVTSEVRDTEYAVVVDDVRKSFGDVHALQGVSFRAERGACSAFSVRTARARPPR